MEEMILAGRITVNRMPAEVGQKVGPGDEVRINGEVVKVRFTEPRPRVLMYHKPAGELVTRDDPEGRPTVFEKLPSIGNGRWIDIGRLDYNTEGLLLFTNSGELANRLMHPRYEVEREYAVRVMGRLTDEQIQALTSGIELDDGPARCEKVSDGGGDEDGSNHWYHVVLKEGRNREVRRIFEALGLMVSRLIRIRFGTLAMPTHLKRGHLAELESPDVDTIVASAGLRGQQGRPPVRAKARHANVGTGPASPGGRPKSRPHKSRPHGQRGQAPSVQGQAGQARSGASGEAPGLDPVGAPSSPGGASQRPAHASAKKHGAWKKRGANGKPANTGPQRPPQGEARRKPGKPRPPQGQRPPRAGHNFDEVQPQSNANASPFGRSTLSAPGGSSPGYGNNTGSPRHRSGPRAQRAGNANGHARNQSAAASFNDRRDMEPVYKVPARPVTQTQIRSKRTRTVVQADIAADADGTPALRRLLNDGKS
jgi:23S rRNA pseudouridine2605 synthase